MPTETTRKHKLTTAAVLMAVLIIVVLFWPQQDSLNVTFLDVGQGDSAIIRTPTSKTVLVDGGGTSEGSQRSFDTGEKIVLPYMRRHSIRRIDLVIATHPHDDHIGGLVSVVKEMPVKALLDSGVEADSETHKELLQIAHRARSKLYTARRGMLVHLDKKTSLTVLHAAADNPDSSDVNDSSIVFLLKYGETGFIFTGDCSEEVEMKICREYPRLRAQVLKVGHHGSASSSSYTWLNHIKPQVAVVSVGNPNQFNLPSDAALSRLKSAGCRIFRTDKHGAVNITTDGSKLIIRTHKKAGTR